MGNSTILIKNPTRERLKRIGRKGQTYDEIIDDLLNQKEYENSLDRRMVSLQSSESHSA